MAKYTLEEIKQWAERYKILGSFSAVGREFAVEKSVIGRKLIKYKDLLYLKFKDEIEKSLFENGKKTCSSCNKIKELNEFYHNARNTDGFDGRCSKCHEQKREQYLCSEKGKQTRQNWLDTHKDYIEHKNREYYENNKDQILANNVKWRDEHKELSNRIQNESRRKREANKALINDAGLTKEDIAIVRFVFDNKCAKCKSIEKICLDHHYPLSRGFALTVDNVVLLCKKCNSSKGCRFPEDFYTNEELHIIQDKIIKVGELINGSH